MLKEIIREEHKLSYNINERLKREIIKLAREGNSGSVRGGKALRDKSIARILTLTTNERLWAKAEFDREILVAVNEGIVKTPWEEVFLHTSWAVMPQMIRDMERNGVEIFE